MGERTSAGSGDQPGLSRRRCSSRGAAERVIVAAMPELRAAMHLDTVFTFADRDCVLLYPDIVYGITRATRTGRATSRAAMELPHKEEKPFVEAVG